MMDKHNFLETLRDLKARIREAAKLPGRKRPHQPILLLIALSGITQGKSRLQTYSALQAEYNKLFKTYGLPDRACHPEQPFKALRSTHIWEISGFEKLRQCNGTLLHGQLIKLGTTGGFTEEVYNLLLNNQGIVYEAISILLDDFFPWMLHEDILNDMNLEDIPDDISPVSSNPHRFALYNRRIRDPRFSKRILRAYQHRCAVCRHRLTIGGLTFGLEAAHIRAYCYDGPNNPDNGLALCTLHHKALDIGAIGLEQSDGAFHLLVSKQARGDRDSLRTLTDYQGSRIWMPPIDSLSPNPEYVQWHRAAIFRDPVRT